MTNKEFKFFDNNQKSLDIDRWQMQKSITKFVFALEHLNSWDVHIEFGLQHREGNFIFILQTISQYGSSYYSRLCLESFSF